MPAFSEAWRQIEPLFGDLPAADVAVHSGGFTMSGSKAEVFVAVTMPLRPSEYRQPEVQQVDTVATNRASLLSRRRAFFGLLT